MFVKRYDLLKTDDFTFKLQYKNEIIWLKANNWEEAEEEAKKIIEKMRKENKNKNIIITFD